MATLAGRAIAADDASAAAWVSLEALRFAFRAELLEGPAAIVARDTRRQAGTKKQRRPNVDVWLDKAVAADSGAKAPALWAMAPDWITDQIGADRSQEASHQRQKTRRK